MTAPSQTLIIPDGHEDYGDPWEQLPEESNVQYNYFQAYLDSSRNAKERSIAEVARSLSLSPRTLYIYSKEHDWVERAAAYDRHLVQQERRQLLEQQATVKRRTYDASLKLHAEIVKQIETAFAQAEVVAQQVTRAIAHDEGVPEYQVKMMIDGKSLEGLASALAKVNRELRISAQLPTNISQNNMNIKHGLDDDNIESFLRKKHNQLEG